MKKAASLPATPVAQAIRLAGASRSCARPCSTQSAVEIAAIIQALVVKAMTGDVQAAKVVLSYTIGKPEAMKDPDLLEVGDWVFATDADRGQIQQEGKERGGTVTKR